MDAGPKLNPQVDGGNDAAATLANAVYERLKTDILMAELPPGAKLRVDFVRDRYGFGSSPVREALTRLAEEGFARRAEGRGFFVAETSPEQFVEITETRCWLEEVALRKSIEKGGTEWEEALVLAFHRLSRASRPAAGTELAFETEWAKRHKAFHDALIGACGSRRLLAYCQHLREQAYRYRRISGAERPGGTLKEHEALMRAALDHDAGVAVPLLMEHYRSRAVVTLQRIREIEAARAVTGRR